MKRINVYLKTTILLAGLSALFLVIGYYFGGQAGIIYALIFALIFNFISYWFSDKIVLASVGAREADWDSIESIKSDIQKLCKKMNIPLPKLYIMDSAQPNAFATGRNPQNSVVCVTTALINQLDKEQIVAVIAHELGHIQNRDVLISTIAAVIASAISSIVNFAAWFGFSGSRDEKDNGGNIISALLLIITAPILAMILQFAISRSREYEADSASAKYTGKPEDLASALVAIDNTVKQVPMRVNKAYNSLFIHSPINAKGIVELFSTHPSTEKRVERLMNMKE